MAHERRRGMRRRARTFGRARNLTRGERRFERALARAYGHGWAATVARVVGLQRPPVLREHTIELAGRAPAAPPLRIGFASDFHAGPTTHPDVLARACRLLADARPDVLLLAGDFVSLHARHVDALLPHLAAIRAPLGSYAVLGNHDLVGDDAYITDCLTEIGVVVLTNGARPLPPPHDDVWVCGLDDPTRGAACGACALDQVPPDARARLVLMHSPDGLLSIGDRAFDAAFCGHTHGGQVVLPTGYAPVVPEGRLSRRFLHGVFRLYGGATLLVSRGVGFSMIPARFLSRSEVHLISA
jgi:hypothetical protein